jgi:uncharacterized protein involved in type VI secretion and phage assembly
MTDGLINSMASDNGSGASQRIYGVVVAQVISNMDALTQGRVQLKFPWMPGVEPWARVAAPSAGSSRGMYFIPQVGDEVLVAFEAGDVNHPYVIGSLWNMSDRPPATLPTDAINKRVIKTPLGHEIEIDDLTQSINISTNTGQKIEIDPTAISLSTTGGTAAVKLETTGTLTIQAALRIEIKAASISLEGELIEIKSSAAANIDGGLACSIQGQLVKIN